MNWRAIPIEYRRPLIWLYVRVVNVWIRTGAEKVPSLLRLASDQAWERSTGSRILEQKP